MKIGWNSRIRDLPPAGRTIAYALALGACASFLPMFGLAGLAALAAVLLFCLLIALWLQATREGFLKLADSTFWTGENLGWSEVAPGWRWMMLAGGGAVTCLPLLATEIGSPGEIVQGLASGTLLLALFYLPPLLSERPVRSFGVVIVLLGFGTVVSVFGGRSSHAPRWNSMCINDLKQAALSIRIRIDSQGGLPKSADRYFLALIYSGDGYDPSRLRCRLAKSKSHPPGLLVSLPGIQGGMVELDYEFNEALAGKTAAELSALDGSQVPLLWEMPVLHERGRLVAFLDGCVRAVPEPEFQALLREQTAGTPAAPRPPVPPPPGG